PSFGLRASIHDLRSRTDVEGRNALDASGDFRSLVHDSDLACPPAGGVRMLPTAVAARAGQIADHGGLALLRRRQQQCGGYRLPDAIQQLRQQLVGYADDVARDSDIEP